MSKWVKEGRSGEKIGGGVIVMRRHRSSNRVSPAKLPFEYATIGEAYEQAEKLAKTEPGHSFEVWERQATIKVEAPAVEAPKETVAA